VGVSILWFSVVFWRFYDIWWKSETICREFLGGPIDIEDDAWCGEEKRPGADGSRPFLLLD
jgi:hypothetical protein